MSADRAPAPYGDDAPDPAVADSPADAAPRIRIDVPWSVFAKAIVAMLLTLGLFRFFQQVTAVVVIITLALFLTAVLSPLADWIQRRGAGRGMAALLSVAAAVLVVLALFGLILPPLIIEGIEFAEDLPNQLERLRRLSTAYPTVFEGLQRTAMRIRQDPARFFTGFLRAGASAVNAVFSAVIVLTLALYLLIDQERVRAAVLDHLPARHRERADRTITGVARAVRGYFTGQAIVSTIFAVLTFLVLTILGVPYATVLAAIAFFLDAIPNIGATLATIVPALVAFASEGIVDALIVVGVFMVYQQVENNVVSPRVLGEKLEISPVLTLVAILVGGAVLGVIGVIIAIPLAGTLPVIDRIWIRGDGAGAGEPPAEVPPVGGEPREAPSPGAGRPERPRPPLPPERPAA
ncbi:MAG TPA: AI-2E family transporter [Longimicrobiales bacterium]